MRTLFITVAALCLTFSLNAQSSGSTKGFTRHDRMFIKCAAEDNLMEEKMGQLAETKGSTQEVKLLGKMLAKDHHAANEELVPLAAEAGVDMPSGLDSRQQKMYNKLSSKSGKDFDKCYTKAMGKWHKHEICEYKKEVKKGDMIGLEDWAGKKLPVLEEHKKMTEEACKAVAKK